MTMYVMFFQMSTVSDPTAIRVTSPPAGSMRPSTDRPFTEHTDYNDHQLQDL